MTHVIETMLPYQGTTVASDVSRTMQQTYGA